MLVVALIIVILGTVLFGTSICTIIYRKIIKNPAINKGIIYANDRF